MAPPAVVTGSDSGIGRSVAVELARRGLDVGGTWAVDGGMLQMGPMAGSHLTSDDWRTP